LNEEQKEISMPTGRKVTIALWALGAAIALALTGVSVLMAGEGLLPPWALVAFMWSAAMVAGLAHHLAAPDPCTRYRLRHKPLAGPREGAQLPS
jgi:hypothetical protein